VTMNALGWTPDPDIEDQHGAHTAPRAAVMHRLSRRLAHAGISPNATRWTSPADRRAAEDDAGGGDAACHLSTVSADEDQELADEARYGRQTERDIHSIRKARRRPGSRPQPAELPR